MGYHNTKYGEPIFAKETLLELKLKIDTNTVVNGGFQTSHLPIDNL